MKNTVSRRRFVGGMAAAVASMGLRPGSWAQSTETVARRATVTDDYDSFAKLASNENPYGPPESVLQAMTEAFKYANRYRYPDGGIVQTIAALHGVRTENVLLGAGSSEILQIVARTFLQNGKKVVGAEPTYGAVFEYATGMKADAIRLPLLPDHRQDVSAMIKAANANHPNVGFVYVCNPNNPTGMIVAKTEIKRLLDGIPREVPVLVDEAYHHFVEDPNYATAVTYVLEERPVIIARTFSKIHGLAGMRLGYAVAPRALIDRMRPHSSGMSINAIVKWGAAAALKDTAAENHVKTSTIELRKKTTAELERLGYPVIPSEANFFMMHIRRQVMPVIQEFRTRGVLVGRPFPPMLDYLRVSIGTAEEMDRFLVAFKEIFPASK